MNQTTTVYTAWSADGLPLYVGITACFGTRAGQHQNSSSWWLLAANITLEHHPTRKSAEAREKQLVQVLDPQFNIRLKARPIAALAISPGLRLRLEAAERRRQREDHICALRLQGLSWREVTARSGMRPEKVRLIARDLRAAGRIPPGPAPARFTNQSDADMANARRVAEGA